MSGEHTPPMFRLILNEINVVYELVGDVQEMFANLPTWAEFDGLKQDVKTFMVALTATNRNIANLDRGVPRFEAA